MTKLRLLPLLFVALTLAACGGPAAPAGTRTIDGQVLLPRGHQLDLATLTVTTVLGSFPVAADGKFEASVLQGAVSEVGAEDAGGALLLLGVSGGGRLELSLTSTAEALLYYAVGGMWLPAEQQDQVRELLKGRPEAAPVARELERQLLAGGNGLAEPDADLLAALEAAHASLFAGAELTEALVGPATCRAQLEAAGTGDTSIIIEPATATQAGVQVLHNPAGAGVVAQNQLRRPAALLAYEVAWEDADRVSIPVDPPVLVERVEVPATSQLELLHALLDVITGDAPWTPVLSSPLNLVGHLGASRTHYELILLGPSATDAEWPIMRDARFKAHHGEWDDIVMDKSVDLFLGEMLLPLIEMYGLGRLEQFDAAQLKRARDRVRIIYDKHLMGLGVYLTQGQVGYANALKFMLEELAQNKMFRLDMMGVVADALSLSDKNKASIDAIEKRLSSRASASAIVAAVQGILVSGDLSKIAYDLAGAPAVVSWQAESAPALFVLTPTEARITRDMAQAEFTVRAITGENGNYLYRWTTSGNYGTISDYLQDGTTLDTRSPEILYTHDYPIGITANDVDTIMVEVFQVEGGATTIAPDALPIARLQALVRGEVEPPCIPHCEPFNGQELCWCM
ncbi:MAG: hypothetical protein WC972_03380 [Trueperaceae bacterium]